MWTPATARCFREMCWCFAPTGCTAQWMQATSLVSSRGIVTCSLPCGIWSPSPTRKTAAIISASRPSVSAALNASACTAGGRTSSTEYSVQLLTACYNISVQAIRVSTQFGARRQVPRAALQAGPALTRSEEHTSELQSLRHLVCRLLLEKKNKNRDTAISPRPPKYVQTTRTDVGVDAAEGSSHASSARSSHLTPPTVICFFFFLINRGPPKSSLFPHPAPFRS